MFKLKFLAQNFAFPPIIAEFSKIGLDTAKAVLEQDVDDLVRRTDLEEETIKDVMSVLRSEFEE